MESIAEPYPERNLQGRRNSPSLVGKVFNRWTVISFAGRDSRRRYIWDCRCECGIEKIIDTHSLTYNISHSCGCYNFDALRARYTHIHRDRKLLQAWLNMNQRCYNANHPRYRDWGMRGIRVCDEWRNDFDVFAEWSLAHGYVPELTIDRTNNSGDYTPDNCQWTTRSKQMRNRRNNHVVSAFGEEKCLYDWADDDRCIVSVELLSSRIRQGIDPEMAITTSIQKSHGFKRKADKE